MTDRNTLAALRGLGYDLDPIDDAAWIDDVVRLAFAGERETLARRLCGGGTLDEARAAADDMIAALREITECRGHPAGTEDLMGVTTYCDGSCRRTGGAS